MVLPSTPTATCSEPSCCAVLTHFSFCRSSRMRVPTPYFDVHRYYRAAIIYLEVMKEHKAFHDPKSAKVKADASSLCREALSKNESLTVMLKEKFAEDAKKEIAAAQIAETNKVALTANVQEIDRLDARLAALEARRARRIGAATTVTPRVGFADAAALPSPPASLTAPVAPKPSGVGAGGVGGASSLYPSLDGLADFDVQPIEGLSPDGFRWVHLPARLIPEFRARAMLNSNANRETCGLLAGKLKNGALYVTALVLPPQTGAADSCSVVDDIPAFTYMEVCGFAVLCSLPRWHNNSSWSFGVG